MKRCSVILNGIKGFHPAYFAMVMATGIMSIAFEAMAFPGIAKALFILNLIFYLTLCTILAVRIIFFQPDLMADLRTLQRAVLFLTFVVGTNTIGMQFVIFQQSTVEAILLWLVALAGWLGCPEALATRTIEVMTFGLIRPEMSIYILAAWETLIGLGLIFGVWMRATLLLLFLQMLGTMTPLFFFPAEVFTRIPYAPTLEGQYIIKNLVLISAGIVLGATVRGGGIVSEARALQRERAPAKT